MFAENEASESTWPGSFKMSASDEILSKDMNTLKLSGDNAESVTSKEDTFQTHWGFYLPDLYKLALRFYKGQQPEKKDGGGVPGVGIISTSIFFNAMSL